MASRYRWWQRLVNGYGPWQYRSHLLLDFGNCVGTGGFDVKHRKAGGGKRVVDERVAILAVLAVMAGVVEFDREDGLHRG